MYVGFFRDVFATFSRQFSRHFSWQFSRQFSWQFSWQFPWQFSRRFSRACIHVCKEVLIRVSQRAGWRAGGWSLGQAVAGGCVNSRGRSTSMLSEPVARVYQSHSGWVGLLQDGFLPGRGVNCVIHNAQHSDYVFFFFASRLCGRCRAGRWSDLMYFCFVIIKIFMIYG